MDEKLLQLYFEGRTTDEQSRLITEWLNADDANMKQYLRLCRLHEISIWNDNLHITTTSLKRKATWHNIWQDAIKIAAVFILGFTLSYWFAPISPKGVEMQTMYVPAGQNAQLTLADGSRVWLNAGSKLVFPTNFIEGKRQVHLEGEGFFEVKSDGEKPFVVSTPHYDIKALGTSFNVSAYAQSKTFETALLTGIVEISDRTTNHTISLKPNTRAVLVNNDLSVISLDSPDYYLWRDGIIYFDNPLTEVFKRLELYFDINIQINNQSILLNERHCTGKFRARDGLYHILDVLQLTNHFKYEKDEERNLIIIN